MFSSALDLCRFRASGLGWHNQPTGVSRKRFASDWGLPPRGARARLFGFCIFPLKARPEGAQLRPAPTSSTHLPRKTLACPDRGPVLSVPPWFWFSPFNPGMELNRKRGSRRQRERRRSERALDQRWHVPPPARIEVYSGCVTWRMAVRRGARALVCGAAKMPAWMYCWGSGVVHLRKALSSAMARSAAEAHGRTNVTDAPDAHARDAARRARTPNDMRRCAMVSGTIGATARAHSCACNTPGRRSRERISRASPLLPSWQGREGSTTVTAKFSQNPGHVRWFMNHGERSTALSKIKVS